jgi:predicted ATPase
MKRSKSALAKDRKSSVKKHSGRPIAGTKTMYLHVFKEGGRNKYLMSVYKSMNLGGTLIDKKMFDFFSKQEGVKIIRHKTS